jgi:hypothetical protein
MVCDWHRTTPMPRRPGPPGVSLSRTGREQGYGLADVLPRVVVPTSNPAARSVNVPPFYGRRDDPSLLPRLGLRHSYGSCRS